MHWNISKCAKCFTYLVILVHLLHMLYLKQIASKTNTCSNVQMVFKFCTHLLQSPSLSVFGCSQVILKFYTHLQDRCYSGLRTLECRNVEMVGYVRIICCFVGMVLIGCLFEFKVILRICFRRNLWFAIEHHCFCAQRFSLVSKRCTRHKTAGAKSQPTCLNHVTRSLLQFPTSTRCATVPKLHARAET